MIRAIVCGALAVVGVVLAFSPISSVSIFGAVLCALGAIGLFDAECDR